MSLWADSLSGFKLGCSDLPYCYWRIVNVDTLCKPTGQLPNYVRSQNVVNTIFVVNVKYKNGILIFPLKSTNMILSCFLRGVSHNLGFKIILSEFFVEFKSMF